MAICRGGGTSQMNQHCGNRSAVFVCIASVLNSICIFSHAFDILYLYLHWFDHALSGCHCDRMVTRLTSIAVVLMVMLTAALTTMLLLLSLLLLMLTFLRTLVCQRCVDPPTAAPSRGAVR